MRQARLCQVATLLLLLATASRAIAVPADTLEAGVAAVIADAGKLELRARARRALGEKFDVRAFHDAVLAEGALPLDVLETLIDDWIARRKASTGNRQ